jgi:hypothetical protein
MARDEQQRLFREARMRKGKKASTASARREKVDQNPYPKTRKCRDPRLVGEGSQAQMDYSSQVVDPTSAHDYVDPNTRGGSECKGVLGKRTECGT